MLTKDLHRHIMAWKIQASVRRNPFGKVVGQWFQFDVQPTAADLVVEALGRQAEEDFDVYDLALLLEPSTPLTLDMCLLICPK